DVARVRGVVAQLLADLRDDVSGVVFVADRVVTPDLAQQRGMRDRLAGMQGEVPQELVLGRGGPHPLPAHTDRAMCEVDLEVARANHWFTGGDVGLPAQHRADARDQLV